MKLFTGSPEREVAQANCAVEGHAPELTWVGENSFSRIEAWWEATYENPFKPVPPTKTTHIAEAGFGVAYTNAEVTLSSSSFGNPIGKSIVCLIKCCVLNIKVTPSQHALQYHTAHSVAYAILF